MVHSDKLDKVELVLLIKSSKQHKFRTPHLKSLTVTNALKKTYINDVIPIIQIIVVKFAKLNKCIYCGQTFLKSIFLN